MTFFVLQGAPNVPIVLGPVGTITYTVLLLLLAALVAYQWYKSQQATQWKGTAEAFEKELVLVRQRSERLEKDNIELVRVSAELKAKTDLSSLEQQNLEADRRNQEEHERIVAGLNTLLENNATRYAQISAVLLENTGGIRSLGERMTNEMELHRGAFANMIRVLHERTDEDQP